MNKILIVHLKRYGDLISAGQVASNLKAEYPHSQISLLCFEEFSNVAKLIPRLTNTYTISRNTLMTLRGGKLYNNGFALDQLRQSLMPLLEQQWDKVINFTNDKASAHLCSWFSAHNKNTKIVGTSIDNNGLVRSSNSWAVVFNDVLPRSLDNSPFNFRDVWAQMIGVEDRGYSSLLTNSRNERTVSEHFNTLRQRGGKIIGVQATCSVVNKGFSIEVVADIATKVKAKGDFPILLIAPTDNERQFANDIIEHLEFKPIVVESDFTALSSVVKNLDLLITPDTVTKHFADAHDIACVEVSLGSSPTFKQATVCEKSLLLIANNRVNAQVSADEIFSATNHLLNDSTLNISNNTRAYKPRRLNGVISYELVAGQTDLRNEFDRHALTSLTLKSMNVNGTQNDEYAQMAIKAQKGEGYINKWSAATKEQASDTMKELLHAIRALLQMKDNPRKSGEFVNALERVFSFTEELTPATLGVHFFRARVESLPPANFSENTRAIEALLFELKADLQNTLSLVNEWEKIWTASKFSSRKNRVEAQQTT